MVFILTNRPTPELEGGQGRGVLGVEPKGCPKVSQATWVPGTRDSPLLLPGLSFLLSQVRCNNACPDSFPAPVLLQWHIAAFSLKHVSHRGCLG